MYHFWDWGDASAYFVHLLRAFLPLDIHDLGEFQISRVGGEQASGGGDCGCEADLRIDVEHASGAAWRPDDRSAIGLVVLEVVAGQGTNKVVLSGGLSHN